MELQKIIIHLARRRQFSRTNVYRPPHHRNDQSWLDHLPKELGLVCGDINDHHSSWDDYVNTDHRVSALHDWMEAHSLVVLNDGSPTRVARGDQSAGISTPDVSLVDTAMAHRLSWEAIPELGSDHLLLLLIRDKDIKVESVHTR